LIDKIIINAGVAFVKHLLVAWRRCHVGVNDNDESVVYFGVASILHGSVGVFAEIMGGTNNATAKIATKNL